jgi:ketosteroid isomerase-like protein
VDVRDEIVAAAQSRAAALVAADTDQLNALLHEDFRWTSHRGETYRRDEYIRHNTDGRTLWRSQEMTDTDVVVVGDTAVLYAEVVDVVASGEEPQAFAMPMTQVWVRTDDRWQCLAGHAGPLTNR